MKVEEEGTHQPMSVLSLAESLANVSEAVCIAVNSASTSGVSRLMALKDSRICSLYSYFTLSSPPGKVVEQILELSLAYPAWGAFVLPISLTSWRFR